MCRSFLFSIRLVRFLLIHPWFNFLKSVWISNFETKQCIEKPQLTFPQKYVEYSGQWKIMLQCSCSAVVRWTVLVLALTPTLSYCCTGAPWRCLTKLHLKNKDHTSASSKCLSSRLLDRNRSETCGQFNELFEWTSTSTVFYSLCDNILCVLNTWPFFKCCPNGNQIWKAGWFDLSTWIKLKSFTH